MLNRILILLILALPAQADEVLPYADWLYQAQRYEDAVLEYKRWLYLNPGDESHDYAGYRLGQCYYHLDHFPLAQRTWQRMLDEHPESPLDGHAQLMLGKSYLRTREYGDASLMFHHLAMRMEGSRLGQQALYFKAWAAVGEREWYLAITEFRRAARASSQRAEVAQLSTQLADTILEHTKRRRRSPGLARWLSTFLPGSGQIYSGRMGNGLVSAVLNAGFFYLLGDAIHDGRTVDAIGIYLLGSRFYWGNISNAVQASQEHNRRVDNQLETRLQATAGTAY